MRNNSSGKEMKPLIPTSPNNDHGGPGSRPPADLETMSNMSRETTDRKRAPPPFSGPAYRGRNENNICDQWRHFSSMGHEERVNCVSASRRAEFIITGGVDCSARIYYFDALYDAYLLVAVLEYEPWAMPTEARHWSAPGGKKSVSCWERCCMGNDVDWDLVPPYGVTAVATTQSARTRHGTNMRTGPFFAGTSEGSLSVIDLCAKTEQSMTFHRLHKGAINDICVAPTYPGKNAMASSGGDFLVVTGGNDCIAKMLRMEVREISKGPDLLHVPYKFENSSLLDCMFFGGGWKFAQGEEAGQGRHSQEKIRDLEMNGGEQEDDVPFMQQMEFGEGQHQDYELSGWLKLVGVEEVRTFKHAAPVLSVKHLGDNRDNESRAMFASLTHGGVHLWSLQGQQLMMLRINARETTRFSGNDTPRSEFVEARRHVAMASNVYKEQGLLMVSGDEHVGVWGIQAGIIGTKSTTVAALDFDPAVWKQKVKYNAAIEPMCVYQRTGRLMSIDQAKKSTTFVVQATDDFGVAVWGTEAVDPGELALEPPNPGSLLKAPGKEKSLLNIVHTERINHIVTVEDATNPYLISACDDGQVFVWDLEGYDKGQVLQELRSLDSWDVVLPPILMIIGNLQVLSFAFTRNIFWPKHVSRFMDGLHSLLLWDFDYLVDLKETDLRINNFWREQICVVICMISFVILGLRGMPQKLDLMVRNQRMHKATKREKTGFGPHRIRLRLVRFLRNFVYMYMQMCSTIFVAPMFLKIARACPPLACTRPFGTPWTDYLGGNPNHRIFLSHLPYIKCVEGGHLLLTVMFSLLIIPFIYVMIPYYTCSGDGRYVVSQTLDPFWKHEDAGNRHISTWGAWKAASIRKASALHLSFLHYTPKNAFITLLCELFAKILVPCLTTVADKAAQQMMVLCLVCIGIWVISIFWAPYLDRKFCVFVQDLKLFAACCAGCAIIAGAGISNTDASSTTAWHMLIVCGILVLLLFIIQMCVIRRPKIVVRKFTAEGQGSNAKNSGRGNRSPNGSSPNSA